MGSRLGTELGGRIPKLDFELVTVLDIKTSISTTRKREI
jgi:hypothetical protein